MAGHREPLHSNPSRCRCRKLFWRKWNGRAAAAAPRQTAPAQGETPPIPESQPAERGKIDGEFERPANDVIPGRGLLPPQRPSHWPVGAGGARRAAVLEALESGWGAAGRWGGWRYAKQRWLKLFFFFKESFSSLKWCRGSGLTSVNRFEVQPEEPWLRAVVGERAGTSACRCPAGTKTGEMFLFSKDAFDEHWPLKILWYGNLLTINAVWRLGSSLGRLCKVTLLKLTLNWKGGSVSEVTLQSCVRFAEQWLLAINFAQLRYEKCSCPAFSRYQL